MQIKLLMLLLLLTRHQLFSRVSSICEYGVLAVSFVPSFTVLSSYFYVSISMVAVPTVCIMINFVAQLH